MMNTSVRLFGRSGSGPIVRMRMVWSSALLTLATEDRSDFTSDAVERARSSENSTSSAVERRAVVEGDARAQLELPDQRIAGQRPGDRERRHHLAVELAHDQRLVELMGDEEVRPGVGGVRVERGGVDRARPAQRAWRRPARPKGRARAARRPPMRQPRRLASSSRPPVPRPPRGSHFGSNIG